MSANNLNTNSSNNLAQPVNANIFINSASVPGINNMDLSLITKNLDNNFKINELIAKILSNYEQRLIGISNDLKRDMANNLSKFQTDMEEKMLKFQTDMEEKMLKFQNNVNIRLAGVETKIVALEKRISEMEK